MRRLFLTLPLIALAACTAPGAAVPGAAVPGAAVPGAAVPGAAVPVTQQARTVFFTADSALLDDEAKGVVAEAAAIAARYPNRGIRVLGFASNRNGTPQFHDVLSETRARAVADALIAAGVARNRVRVEPQGGVEPILTGIEARRVELRLAD